MATSKKRTPASRGRAKKTSNSGITRGGRGGRGVRGPRAAGVGPSTITPSPSTSPSGKPVDLGRLKTTALGVLEIWLPQAIASPSSSQPVGSSPFHPWPTPQSDASKQGQVPIATTGSPVMHLPSASDFELQPYRGWRIPGPSIMLRHAIHFLADEDVDRTPDWDKKCAALTEYFSHLLANLSNEPWGPDLALAISMLRTHRLVEEHHYGEQALPINLSGAPPLSGAGTGLPSSTQGPDIWIKLDQERGRGRNRKVLTGRRGLMPRAPESVHDHLYNLPPDLLVDEYLGSYKRDVAHFDIKDKGSDSRQPNLAREELATYEKCKQKGLAYTVDAMSNHGQLIFSSGAAEEEQGEAPSIQGFARFRGAKRAALECCLTQFGNSLSEEEMAFCHPLVLPNPVVAQKELGVVFEHQGIEHVPDEESRDPLELVRAHENFKRTDCLLASQRQTVTASSGHEDLQAGPTNWKGPQILPSLQETERKALELLTKYRGMHQAMQRQRRRAPRRFMDEVLRYIDLGRTSTDHGGLRLQFRPAELMMPDMKDLAPIRRYEILLLSRLCWQSHKRPVPAAPGQPRMGDKGRLLAARVASMLADPDPKSFFRTTKKSTIEKFIKALNAACGGKVRRHEFTIDEAKANLPDMARLGLLECSVSNRNCWIQRPRPDMHPEDRTIWPEELLMDLIAGNSSEPTIQGSPALGWTDNHDTTGVEGAPLTALALSLQQCFFGDERDKIDQNRAKTENFFYCLAFRLGRTLVGLEKEADKIRDAENLLEAFERHSQGTTAPSPNSQSLSEKGKAQPGLTYRSMLHQLDPSSYQDYARWNLKGVFEDEIPSLGDSVGASASETPPDAARSVGRHKEARKRTLVEEHCKRIVHRSITRAAYENYTMLWPVAQPLPIGTSDRPGGDGGSAPVRRREPVWSFAHPLKRHRKSTPRFWSLDRWPLHIQAKETQEEIRASGPKLPSALELQQQAQEQQQAQQLNPVNLEICQTYAQEAAERRSFHPGPTEFWSGDTPLQRKTIEMDLRNNFEMRRKKKSRWRAMLFGAPRPGHRGASLEDVTLRLPDLPTGLTPESVADETKSAVSGATAAASTTTGGGGSDVRPVEAESGNTSAASAAPAISKGDRSDAKPVQVESGTDGAVTATLAASVEDEINARTVEIEARHANDGVEEGVEA